MQVHHPLLHLSILPAKVGGGRGGAAVGVDTPWARGWSLHLPLVPPAGLHCEPGSGLGSCGYACLLQDLTAQGGRGTERAMTFFGSLCPHAGAASCGTEGGLYISLAGRGLIVQTPEIRRDRWKVKLEELNALPS